MRLFKNFINNQDGVIATIIAISFVGLLLAIIAVSVDLNRVQTSYNKNYNATDAAALATAEWWLRSKVNRIGQSGGDNPLAYEPAQTEFEQYARGVLQENYNLDHNSSRILDGASLEVNIDKSPDEDKNISHSVQVNACSCITTTIATTSGIKDEDEERSCSSKDEMVCTSSTAAFTLGKLQNVEVAFALDFTESMFWDKIRQSCPAVNEIEFADPDEPVLSRNPDCPALFETKAQNLVDTMSYIFDTYFSDDEDSTAYASVVPYSGFVNLYPYNQTMMVQNAGNFQVDNTRSQWSEAGNNFTLGNHIYTFINSQNISHIDNGDYNRHRILSEFLPFYTSEFSPQTPIPGYRVDRNYGFLWGRGADRLSTKDYSYVLDRIPVFTRENLGSLANASDSSSLLPRINNYTHNLEFLKNKNVMIDLANEKNVFRGVTEPNEMYRRNECYNGLIAAGADQRIEKAMYSPSQNRSEREGEIRSSTEISRLNGNRGIELHESFTVQPLTNNVNILRQQLDRFISDEFLYTNALSSISANEEDVIDRQRSRLNKARDFSAKSDTSSIHGLLWAWFNISNDWEGEWDALSLTESYCDESNANLGNFDGEECRMAGEQSRRNREQNDLPKEENVKHIIMISDGYDIDGMEAKSAAASANANQPLGYRNACDAYTPVDRVSFGEYVDICERIGEEDVKVHVILYDFAPDANNDGYQADLADSGSLQMGRFEACADAADGNYYTNVSPIDSASESNSLRDALDEIFVGILTDLTPVKLVN